MLYLHLLNHFLQQRFEASSKMNPFTDGKNKAQCSEKWTQRRSNMQQHTWVWNPGPTVPKDAG